MRSAYSCVLLERESERGKQPPASDRGCGMDDGLRYWSVPAVGELLAVSSDKILGWIRRGELVAVNVAKRPERRPRWRISNDELQRFLRARQSQPVPAARRARRDDGPVFFRNGQPVNGAWHGR